jgi:hypothetical protein
VETITLTGNDAEDGRALWLAIRQHTEHEPRVYWDAAERRALYWNGERLTADRLFDLVIRAVFLQATAKRGQPLGVKRKPARLLKAMLKMHDVVEDQFPAWTDDRLEAYYAKVFRGR